MGKQQSGVLNLKIADLVKDQEILKLARQKAIELLKEDMNLEKPENVYIRTVFENMAQKNNLWNYIS